jgi:RNA polymerase sigma factor (sigma-70 family)
MAGKKLRTFLRFLQGLRPVGGSAERLKDADLLQAFVERHDQEAFAELVRRHGPMVHGICQRKLRHGQDVEDAFQATFLVLVRNARQVRDGRAGPWLFGVALRVALRAAQRRQRQAVATSTLLVEPMQEDAAPGEKRELRAIIDEEIDRLPARQRDAVLLCYMQGKTYDEAADVLHCHRRTLSAHLNAARERLRQRLSQRGFQLASGSFTTLLARTLTLPAMPEKLLTRTIAQGTVWSLAAETTPPVLAQLVAGAAPTLGASLRRYLTPVLLVGWLGLAMGMAAIPSRAKSLADQANGRVPSAAALNESFDIEGDGFMARKNSLMPMLETLEDRAVPAGVTYLYDSSEHVLNIYGTTGNDYIEVSRSSQFSTYQAGSPDRLVLVRGTPNNFRSVTNFLDESTGTFTPIAPSDELEINIYGGGGSDELSARKANCTVNIYGNKKSDLIRASTEAGKGSVTAYGNGGDDVFWDQSSNGHTTFIGGAGNDSFLIHRTGNDEQVQLTTGGGKDQVFWRASRKSFTYSDFLLTCSDFTKGTDQLQVFYGGWGSSNLLFKK